MEVASAVISVPFTQPWCAGSDTTRAATDYVELRSRLHIFTVVATALYPGIAPEFCAFVPSVTWPHEIHSFVRTSSVQKFRRKSGHRSEISLPRKAAGFNEILRFFYR
jgi:hypothetical protein